MTHKIWFISLFFFSIACNKAHSNTQEPNSHDANNKDAVSVSKHIHVADWGIILKHHAGLAKLMKKRPKPVIYKKNHWIKHQKEQFNFNFPYSHKSNLFIVLEKVTGAPPKNLSEASKRWEGDKRGSDGVKNVQFYGLRHKKVRGPGSRSGGRYRHMLVSEISGYVILPLTKSSYVQCHVHVVESDPTSKKFNEYFDLCRSMSKIKSSN